MSQYTPPPAAGQPNPYAPSYAEDPGRTLGIVGLVLAIVASLIGLIISVIAYRKSKAAGFRNGIALAGIVVGVVTTVLSIISSVVFFTMASSMMTY